MFQVGDTVETTEGRSVIIEELGGGDQPSLPMYDVCRISDLRNIIIMGDQITGLASEQMTVPVEFYKASWYWRAICHEERGVPECFGGPMSESDQVAMREMLSFIREAGFEEKHRSYVNYPETMAHFLIAIRDCSKGRVTVHINPCEYQECLGKMYFSTDEHSATLRDLTGAHRLGSFQI